MAVENFWKGDMNRSNTVLFFPHQYAVCPDKDVLSYKLTKAHRHLQSNCVLFWHHFTSKVHGG